MVGIKPIRKRLLTLRESSWKFAVGGTLISTSLFGVPYRSEQGIAFPPALGAWPKDTIKKERGTVVFKCREKDGVAGKSRMGLRGGFLLRVGGKGPLAEKKGA